MSCINNIDRLIIPNDIIVQLTKVYRYIGMNKEFANVFASDLDVVISQTVERDTFFLSQILELKLTDTRMRLIITKDSNPRTKEETTVSNLKETLMSFQKAYKQMRYQSNDILNIINYVYSHYDSIKYDYIPLEKKSLFVSQNMRGKRVIIDEIIDNTYQNIESGSFEPILLYIHFFLDFYNLQPFMSHNETASFLLLYLLFLKSELEAFKYVSFFEILYQNFEEFKKELKNASYNWQEGYAQTLGLVRFILKLIISAYQRVVEIANNYSFDQKLNKSNNIENTILKFETIFTKEEVRLLHPYVSDSTINRTLMKLREEGLIKPLGRGRSARWIKVEK